MIAVTGQRTYPEPALTPQTVKGVSYTNDNSTRSVPVGVVHSVSIMVLPLSNADVEV